MPTAIVGWSHNLGYKNWSLSATLTSWIDFTVYNAVELEYGLRNVAFSNMLYDAIEKNEKITGRPSPSSYFLYDGTFLKLQNFTLAYTLPMYKYTKLVDNVKFYFTGNNVLRLTKYPGLNPEVDIHGWDSGMERKGDTESGGSTIHGIYPQTRTFTLGLQLNF